MRFQRRFSHDRSYNVPRPPTVRPAVQLSEATPGAHRPASRHLPLASSGSNCREHPVIHTLVRLWAARALASPEKGQL